MIIKFLLKPFMEINITKLKKHIKTRLINF